AQSLSAAQAPAAQIPAPAAAAASKAPAAIVRVRVTLDQGKPTLEITATRPITPVITKLEDPLRLVVDLPNSKMSVNRKHIDIQSPDISGVRLDQYQSTPPVVRVVVDLLKQLSYTSETVGNQLMIRMQAEKQDVTAKLPSVSGSTPGAQPLAVPVSPTPYGKVVFASGLASGAAVTAADEPTILRLSRGGEVHVCPETTISITHSEKGPDLLLGMGTGSIETHYELQNNVDTILTPDFRFLLRGPGEFHFAVSADAQGNTCVKGLPENTGSIIVSELMGDGTYRIAPNQQLVFRGGHVATIDRAPQECGCPAPPVPVMRTALPQPASEENLPPSVHMAQPGDETKPGQAASGTSATQASGAASQGTMPTSGPETASLPAALTQQPHVQVDAPFVYRASGPPLPPIGEAKRLPLTNSVRPAPLPTVALPPASAELKPPHHGFFGKVKGFFSGIFR
ncbi:MAG: AMIN domain-containing protein, partial [Acidobacteriales bacterium]|nr:AMIN domain-containing protein [Terriglobales bacterium]